MATEVHEQYTKVWNVLVASGIDTGSLVPAHLLAVPREVIHELDQGMPAACFSSRNHPMYSRDLRLTTLALPIVHRRCQGTQAKRSLTLLQLKQRNLEWLTRHGR